MRLLIIGLDALDPDLVERWGMDWFKQKTYGRHYVGFFKQLFTPIIWGSFLTGLNVEKHGYDRENLDEKIVKEAYRSRILYILYLLRKRLAPAKDLGLRKLLMKLGLFNGYQGAIMPEHLLKRTFIEELRAAGYRVVAFDVPGYNESRNAVFRASIPELLSKPFDERKKIAELALLDTRARVLKAVKAVEMGYDVVFVYSPLPDIAFHIVTKPSLKAKLWLRTLHYRLYKSTEKLLALAERKGYAILVVSDHGFDLENYYHSDYGFWSLNINPPRWWEIKSVLDFKNNILKLVTEV